MSTVIYVAVVEGDQNGGYSAFFPDLPGCVTAAETMLELPAAARDALSLHLQGMIEDGETLPEPTPLEAVKADPEVKEVGRVLVDAEVEDPLVRVNISIGQQFLQRLDVAAQARGMTRSAFLIEAARAAMEPPVAPREERHIWASRRLGEDLPMREGPISKAGLKQSSAYYAFVPTLRCASAHLGESNLLETVIQSSAQSDRRYLIIPCEGKNEDLAVIWDRVEEQAIDVIDRGVAQHRAAPLAGESHGHTLAPGWAGWTAIARRR
jgi:predicted RNase H-like HicB family nuclease